MAGAAGVLLASGMIAGTGNTTRLRAVGQTQKHRKLSLPVGLAHIRHSLTCADRGRKGVLGQGWGPEAAAEADARDTSANKDTGPGRDRSVAFKNKADGSGACVQAERGPGLLSRTPHPRLSSLQRMHTDLVPIAKLQPLPDEQPFNQQLPVPDSPLLPFLQQKQVKHKMFSTAIFRKNIKIEPVDVYIKYFRLKKSLTIPSLGFEIRVTYKRHERHPRQKPLCNCFRL